MHLVGAMVGVQALWAIVLDSYRLEHRTHSYNAQYVTSWGPHAQLPNFLCGVLCGQLLMQTFVASNDVPYLESTESDTGLDSVRSEQPEEPEETSTMSTVPETIPEESSTMSRILSYPVWTLQPATWGHVADACAASVILLLVIPPHGYSKGLPSKFRGKEGYYQSWKWWEHDIALFLFRPIMMLLICILLYALVRSERSARISRALDLSPLLFIGDLAFEAFLLHSVVLWQWLPALAHVLPQEHASQTWYKLLLAAVAMAATLLLAKLLNLTAVKFNDFIAQSQPQEEGKSADRPGAFARCWTRPLKMKAGDVDENTYLLG